MQAGENAILVNGDRVTIELLEGRIKQLLAGKKSEAERAVIVLAKNDLSFQQHVDVMYAVQRAGGVLVMSEEQ